jgi:hypothetical protein
MRKVIRRPELIPDHKRLEGPRPPLTSDDRLFLDELKSYHSKQHFEYMRAWWENAKS